MKQKLLNFNLVINNEYLDKYVELIKKNNTTEKETFITQEHHIIPKYYFKHNNLPVDNSVENRVHLRFSDHLLAHYYLMKCSSCTEFELANANAIIKSKDNIHSIDLENWIIDNEELLQEINKRRCELISLHHADVSGSKNGRARKVRVYDLDSLELVNECGSKVDAAKLYKIDNLPSLLDIHKIVIIDSKIFTKLTTITKEMVQDELARIENINNKKRINRVLTCSYCGDTYTKYLNSEDYEYRLKNKTGCCAKCSKNGKFFKDKPKSNAQKIKMSNSAKGRKWIHNGDVSKQVHLDELDKYLALGWKLGQSSKQIANR